MSLSFDPTSLELPRGHHIGGRFIEGTAAIEVQAPSDGRRLADIPIADADVVDQAVQAAKNALATSQWMSVRPRERLRAIYTWCDLIEAEAETLARLEAIGSSRPVSEARTGDVMVAAEQIRFFAEFADKEGGDLVPTSSAHHGFISSEPYGVIGAITAWNFPLVLSAWKLGPALAAGNAVVLKPSEMTPFSTLHLAELSVRAGLPAGLVNVLLGDGRTTGASLVSHPEVAKVSFTGSTLAGGAIMENIARTGIKPVTLELGGKSPILVFADADLDLAARCIALGILGNAGQVCVAGSRIIVAREIEAELVDRVSTLMRRVRPGPTWDENTAYCPIISEKQLERIDSIVSRARHNGAEIVCGGQRMDHAGSFYQPTIITSVDSASPAITDEIFGPVITVQPFDDEEEAVELSRHPTYGLCSGVFTRDLSRALRLVNRIEAGTVWVNRYVRSRDHILPTGGWKASGLGKDLGREAYRLSRRTKSVLIDL
jgi:aldehyde dehydrogenase (NAD+)